MLDNIKNSSTNLASVSKPVLNLAFAEPALLTQMVLFLVGRVRVFKVRVQPVLQNLNGLLWEVWHSYVPPVFYTRNFQRTFEAVFVLMRAT